MVCADRARMPSSPPSGMIMGVSLARAAWMTVAGICAIAALLLLVNGYDGYSAVLLFIGLAAAINLLP
jgi:hypothetical protein